MSRDVLQQKLETTTIKIVPLIKKCGIHSVSQIEQLVSGESCFGDSPREGIVIKACVGTDLIARAKLVRHDFIAGMTEGRWERSKIITNSVDYTSTDIYD